MKMNVLILFLAVGLPCFVCPGATQSPRDLLETSVDWLAGESHRLIRGSVRTMKDGTKAFPPQVGIGYQAFWLRDYEYTLEGGIDAYSTEELLASARLFIKSLRADGAGVDCVKYDGTAIYKPGYGSMGENPVADGSQFTVGVAWHTYQKTRDAGFLNEVLDPLVKTMQAVPRNPKTELVHIVPGKAWDRCAYGFTDTAHKQGDVLFCSLLYVQACQQLSDLLNDGGREYAAHHWSQTGHRVARGIQRHFWDAEAGLFRAATVQCREHDIWGSAFAVYLGVADVPQSLAIAHTFKTQYADIVQHGQVRHLPGGVYWEQGCARDSYQNGAFWATPTGWFVY
ncbi:MAG: hypothetical protein HQ515_11215, partial [Phycisphaeraceae bacterium]|nr:hypothetical protein [Phycisphaeraceae bacterium]